MAKRTLLNPLNVLTTLKAWVAGILTMLILIIPIAASVWAGLNNLLVVAWVLRFISMIAGLWIFGWLANKMWGWN